MTEFYGSVRKAFRHVSNVAGLRHLTSFPYWLLRKAASVKKPIGEGELSDSPPD